MQKGSQEGPREGFGIHFKWIWEVFVWLFDNIFNVFGLEFKQSFLDGNVWNMDEKGMACAYILQELPPVLAGLLHR